MVKKKLLMTIRVFGKYSMQSKYYSQHFLRWFLNLCVKLEDDLNIHFKLR